MRFLFFLIIVSTLCGCQSKEMRADPTATLSPAPLSSSTPTASPSPSPIIPTVTATTQIASPEPTVTISMVAQENGALPPVTAEPPQAYPAEPTAVILDSAYPGSATSIVTEPVWRYQIVNEYPHDPEAFTQGLIIEENLNTLLEGTGQASSLRRVDLETGEIEQLLTLADQYFGEDIALFEDEIIQLTWQSQVGFVYDAQTFELLRKFNYPHQGWGLTHDGSYLIVSDGTDIIRFWDPETFQEVRRIQVTGENGPVTQLNELEYVNGEIWANVWYTDLLARISPENGRILGWIDLSGLINPDLLSGSQAVLNGIAYDPQSDRLFVTGKLWPLLFEIELVKPGER